MKSPFSEDFLYKWVEIENSIMADDYKVEMPKKSGDELFKEYVNRMKNKPQKGLLIIQLETCQRKEIIEELRQKYLEQSGLSHVIVLDASVRSYQVTTLDDDQFVLLKKEEV